MPFVTMKDQVDIYYKDWGLRNGPVVVFSHGWPLNSDNWENQMFFLAKHGYRCIAHDRRGHGRSIEQTWEGNDMDTYADDLLALFEHLDLRDAVVVEKFFGSVVDMGQAESQRLSWLALRPRLMLKTEHNPEGLPMEVFDGFRGAMEKDRSQFFRDVPSGPFFGFNRPGVTASQGLIESWYQAEMVCGFKSAYDCIKAFAETNMTEDMKNIDIPVLLIHGDDDQIVPIVASAHAGIKLLKNGTLKVYPGGAHALPNTEIEKLNKDILEFIES